MVIRIELRICDQIDTSDSFDIKNGNPPPPKTGSLKTIVSQTAPLAKLPHGGGSYLFMKCDVFRQNADFFKGIELFSFNDQYLLVSCEGKALGYRSGGHVFKHCNRT